MIFLCIGDNCIDYYENTGEIFCGGNPVNVAVYIARLGGTVSYVGYVGTDDFGKKMIDSIKEKKVDSSHVKIMPGSTAFTHVERINGERVFGDYDEGVMSDFKVSEEDIPFILEHDLLITGRWSHMTDYISILRNMGLPIAFDFADTANDETVFHALPFVDIAFFSDDTSDEKTLLNKMADLYKLMVKYDTSIKNSNSNKIITVTRGSLGSISFDGKSFYKQGIIKCDVKDTMGAGDSFIAGFLYSFMLKKNIPDAMKSGAEAAAVTISYFGAW